jgi:hypothetical protein
MDFVEFINNLKSTPIKSFKKTHFSKKEKKLIGKTNGILLLILAKKRVRLRYDRLG